MLSKIIIDCKRKEIFYFSYYSHMYFTVAKNIASNKTGHFIYLINLIYEEYRVYSFKLLFNKLIC